MDKLRKLKKLINSRGISLRKPSHWFVLIARAFRFLKKYGLKSVPTLRSEYGRITIWTPKQTIWEYIKPAYVELVKAYRAIPNLKKHYTFTIVLRGDDADTLSSVEKQIYDKFDIITGSSLTDVADKITGEYAIFLESGNMLLRNALFEIVLELNRLNGAPPVVSFDHDGLAVRKDALADYADNIGSAARVPFILMTKPGKQYYDKSDKHYTPNPVTYRLLGIPSISTDLIHKIIIVKPDGIGDAVSAMPVIKKIRSLFPNAQIDLLALPKLIPFYEAQPGLDNVIEFPLKAHLDITPLSATERKKKIEDIMLALKKEHYDLSINLLLWGARSDVAAQIADYQLSQVSRDFFVNISHPVSFIKMASNMQEWSIVECFLSLLSFFDFEKDLQEIEIAIPGEAKQNADRFVKESGFFQNGTLIGVHPAASYEGRRWPDASLVAFCKMVLDKTDAKIALFGDALLENNMPEELRTLLASSDRILSVVNQFSLMEFCHIITKVDYLVAMDSGPSHIADAQGVPVLDIFGPGSERVWTPRGNTSMAVKRYMACSFSSPCHAQTGVKKCPDRPCLTKLTAEDIFYGLERLMTLFPKNRADNQNQQVV